MCPKSRTAIKYGRHGKGKTVNDVDVRVTDRADKWQFVRKRNRMSYQWPKIRVIQQEAVVRDHERVAIHSQLMHWNQAHAMNKMNLR